MICRYCRAANSESEHRCQRCGRRLEARSYADAPYVHASAAPQLEPRYAAVSAPSARSAPELVTMPGGASEPRRAPSWQPSLFGTRMLGRVVSLNELSGAKAPRQRKGRAETLGRPRNRRPGSGQQALAFAEASAHARSDAPGQIIGCDAPVAIAAHRVMSAMLDLGLIALAVCVFLLITYALTGNLLLGGHGLMVVGIAAVFGLLYKTLWCLGNGDTPGMYWSRLRTVNFDGLEPEREQRFTRLAAECLSLLAIGLGLLWALVDEEALTWHDHISRTFPTPFPQN